MVLPFENLSPDPENAFFADGLTEELIADLSCIRGLRVVSRTSAMRYRGTGKSVPEIAAELKVRYVLEGSVRRAGNSLRITAQLIEAATDTHLWAEKYSGTLDDVFDIQEKVSRAIVESLRIRLSPAEETRLARRAIPDPEVYDDWLKARHLVRNYGTEGLGKAIARLEGGLKRIGDNPQVMAGLAELHCHAAMLGSQEEEYDQAEAWAARALDGDAALAQAHLTLAMVWIIRGRPRTALGHLKQAQAAEPGDFGTHEWLAYLYAGVGRHAEALIHAHAMVAIDPGEALGHLWVAWVLLYDGRIEEGVAVMERANVELSTPHRRFMVAWTRAWQGQRQVALDVLAPVEASGSYDYLTQLCLLLRDALRGDREAFERDLTPDVVRGLRADAWGACTVAEWFSLLGDTEAALRWLDRAASWGWFNYPLYSRTDPFFEGLRGDPRFQAFLERVKEQWERFDA